MGFVAKNIEQIRTRLFLQHKLYEQKDLETDKDKVLTFYTLKIYFLLTNKLNLSMFFSSLWCVFQIFLVPTSLDLNLSSLVDSNNIIFAIFLTLLVLLPCENN